MTARRPRRRRTWRRPLRWVAWSIAVVLGMAPMWLVLAGLVWRDELIPDPTTSTAPVAVSPAAPGHPTATPTDRSGPTPTVSLAPVQIGDVDPDPTGAP